MLYFKAPAWGGWLTEDGSAQIHPNPHANAAGKSPDGSDSCEGEHPLMLIGEGHITRLRKSRMSAMVAARV